MVDNPFIIEIFGEKVNLLDYENYELTEEEKEELKQVEEYSKKYELLTNKYKKYIDNHYKILETLRLGLYSKAINHENIFNEYSEKVIELCKQDLTNAPYLIKYWTELKGKNILKRTLYGSNLYLIKILEKQQKIEEAIKYCDIYIKLGLDFDNTKSGIKGRKEKLLRKLP